jgi:hypothetical protein
MPLTSAQSTAYQRLLNPGTSPQAKPLTADAVRALIYIAARDLGKLDQLPAPAGAVPELFDDAFVADFALAGIDPRELFAAALAVDPELETFVSCLAAIHKARLKYREVLTTQPFATMDQVGARALLQFNQLDPGPLAALLVWRKWFYDIDNRAAQDTGYLFEPVIAAAIGGTPVAAGASPVRRSGDSRKGRQIDCLLRDRAYEIKIRITIAASGQGRWAEELSFPAEARASNLTPVLIVLDPTPNPKLSEVKAAYIAAQGEAYIGDEAWEHLKSTAQPEMAVFIEKYIREPIEQIFSAYVESDALPALQVSDRRTSVEFRVGEDSWTVPRRPVAAAAADDDPLPDDVAATLPGIDT